MSVPEFVRTAWTSSAARAVWEPRFAHVSNAWRQIEIESVKQRMRPCALTLIPAWRIFELAASLAPGFEVLTLQTLAATDTGYQAFETRTWKPGAKLNLRVAVGRRADVQALRDAFADRDDAAVGGLLGYPRCCIEFFGRVWGGGTRDTTWAAALATASARHDGGTIELPAAVGANLLLRWFGVRPVPHLACAFDCRSTEHAAESFRELGRSAGLENEVEWLRELLSWPMEWSALHGIAEVRIPVAKIVTSTDPTDVKRVVRIQGTSFPLDGARGLAFPYIGNPIRRRPGAAPASHTDNGFSSAAAMSAAHAPLVSAAAAALAEVPGPVLDLGCGNGILLDRIARRTGMSTCGIDADAAKIGRARSLHPTSTFTAGDLFTTGEVWEQSYALALISAARLAEASAERLDQLARRFSTRVSRVLVYAYTDTTIDPELLSSCRLRVLSGSARDGVVVCEPVAVLA